MPKKSLRGKRGDGDCGWRACKGAACCFWPLKSSACESAEGNYGGLAAAHTASRVWVAIPTSHVTVSATRMANAGTTVDAGVGSRCLVGCQVKAAADGRENP